MTVTVKIRPGARTEVRGMPFNKDDRGSNYELLEDAIDATRRGQIKYSGGAFRVARDHTSPLIEFLAHHFGRVHVVQYGGLDRCVAACWDARPETAMLCECSCAGGNHGTGRPIGRIVAETPVGAFSVASAAPREYDVRG